MKRRQLTLFLRAEDSGTIEEIRRSYNPVQYNLILSHITLCREDEIGDIGQVINNLSSMSLKSFELRLGNLIRFNEGKGVYINVHDDNMQFSGLRETVLNHIVDNPRKHNPHITLMHPRNSACNDLIYQGILQYNLPSKITISKVSLIEQEIGQKWYIIQEFPLS